ncbi:unnamed protein product [Thlaspi arvense]|uniref:Glycosyltransferase N-terminal domain-containing protein n=1 Tax=Thlaspi arvense TaxID=13288 RepID=A0AAU9RUN5_THLAR|nr:unnamed protein product [Thlaspi arvense]
MGGEVKVVMLPFLAFGHLIPFHHLATALAKAGVHVIFVSTPNNIRRLPKLPQEIVNMIEFIQFPLPESLLASFLSLVADRSPNWIIADVIPHWAADVARDLDIPLILFNVSLPESFEAPPRWVDFPSSVAFRNHEAVAVHAGLYGKNASGIADAQRLAKLLQASQAIAVRSCKEIENEYLNLYVKITNKPVIPGLNARLLVDKGLAIEVEREEDGSFNRNGVAQCLRRAMEGAEGERLKVRAEEAAAIFSDRKLQDQYVADFVDYLRKGPRK